MQTSTRHPLEIETLAVEGESGIPYKLSGGSLAVSPDRPGILVIELPRMRSVLVKVSPPVQPNGEPWAVWVEPTFHVSVDPLVCSLSCAEYGGFYATEGELRLDVSEGLHSVSLSETDSPAVEVLVDRDPTVVNYHVAEPAPTLEPPPRLSTLIRGQVVDAVTGEALRAIVRPKNTEPGSFFRCVIGGRPPWGRLRVLASLDRTP